MTRPILTTLFAACILFLASCLDTEERIEINKDNSGVYSLTMDMSRMMKMMNQQGKSKDSAKKPQQKDSTLYLKAYVDTSTRLTEQEKDMLRDGSIRINVDELKGIGKFVFALPFKKIGDLPYLRENYMKAINKLNIKDKLDNKEKKEGEANGDEQPQGDGNTGAQTLMPGQNSYVFTAAPGKIANKFTDKASFEKEVGADSTLQMMKGLMSMMGEMTYKTTIVLPKPVKHYSGNNATVSADKKTIVFKNTLTNIFKKPESLAFELDY